MSGYLSNILTQTTSRYNSLRRTLLSNEDDGDTEDDSHISRVLRAYYIEKGRPFPQWLPPDPNARPTPQPTSSYLTPGGYGVGSGPGSGGYFSRPTLGVPAQSATSQRSSLSDLWDSPSSGPQQAQGPQSLRNARRPGVPMQQSSSGLAPPGQGMMQQQQYQQQARPLPSQREGSYQSSAQQMRGGFAGGPPGGGSYDGSAAGGGGTAQDRLKAKLRGGRAPSPALGGGGYDQQQQQQQGRGW